MKNGCNFINENDKETKDDDDDLEDELEKQWEMQNQIHKVCKMKGDNEEKQKKWKEKFG